MFKKISFIALAILSSSAHATEYNKYRYNYSLVSESVPANWQKNNTEYGPWDDVGAPYACSNWSPSTSTVGKGISFVQTATDCKQDQERWAQDYEKNNIDDKIRPLGDRYTVEQTITISQDRDAAGILENWMAFDPTYTSWVDTNALYGCTSWTPNPAVYTETTNFTQTANNCRTDQDRLRQDREQERYTEEIRDVGEPIVESQTLTGQSASRPYSVVLGAWTTSGVPYACSNWSPAVETVGKGITFTQNASDCKLDQLRSRTESFKDHKTGATVPVAKPNEGRTLTNQADSREAIGTLEDWMPTTPTYTAWVNTSALNNCSNWSPASSTKTSTTTFTQTATNCTTDQTRNRQDREMEQNTGEIRNKGSLVVENQTITGQTATRNFTVTLGAWADSGSVYGCSNWSPAVSTVTIGQSFTQTATDCEQDQKRPRTESYVDHKTGQTVSAGNMVESQTLTGQSNTRTATGTKETWMTATPTYTGWVNTNTLYGCGNWSPAGSTKTTTGSFTQTATDCETDQTRQRQDRQQESTTLEYRNVGSPVTENRTLTGQSASRSYTVSLGAWTNSGAVYGCSNWSPDPSTVNSGQSFTQTATDCEQNQARSRSESYVDHKTGSTVAVSVPNESRTLTGQTSTRAATGTKIVSITPTVSITSISAAGKHKCYGTINPAGSISWSGSNVSYYTFNGTNVGLATSRSVNPGTYTVVAYSSTGHTASATGTVGTYTTSPSMNCNK